MHVSLVSIMSVVCSLLKKQNQNGKIWMVVLQTHYLLQMANLVLWIPMQKVLLKLWRLTAVSLVCFLMLVVWIIHMMINICLSLCSVLMPLPNLLLRIIGECSLHGLPAGLFQMKNGLIKTRQKSTFWRYVVRLVFLVKIMWMLGFGLSFTPVIQTKDRSLELILVQIQVLRFVCRNKE